MNLQKAKHNRDRERLIHLCFLLMGFLAIALLFTTPTQAQTGAQIDQNVSVTQKGNVTPHHNNESKGTISTLLLSSEQQNQKWKAYVGNVSSTFVLDDSDDYSIYQWSIDSFTGQVYASRNDSITWGSIACATIANKESEDTDINHDSTNPDSVNRTFTTQIHRSFSVGTTPFNAGDCFSTVTWQNDTQPSHTAGAAFEQVLLWDGDDAIYTTFVENDKPSYRNDAPQTTFDFQLIVPDDATPANPALRYYFYLELS